MATNVTGDILQALIVPDQRLDDPDRLWSAQSTYTEADAMPGVPVTEDASHLEPRASGSPADVSDDMIITTLRSGFLAGSALPPMFGWRYSSESTAMTRGREYPNSINGQSILEYTSILGYRDPDIVTTDDGGVIVAAVDKSLNRILSYRMDPGAKSWGTASTVYQSLTVYTGSVDGGARFPALLSLPGGRVICFFWVDAPTGTSTQTLRAMYSDDYGTTWARYTDRAVEIDGLIDATSYGGSSITYEVGRIRAAYSLGQVLLVAHMISDDASTAGTYLDEVWTFASADLGATFVRTTQYIGSASKGASWPDVVGIPEGGFIVALIQGQDFESFRLRSAYDVLEGYSSTSIVSDWWNDNLTISTSVGPGPATRWTDGALALTRSPDGVLYVHTVSGDTSVPGYERSAWSAVSYDDGDEWQGIGVGPTATGTWDAGGPWWITGDSNGNYPTAIAATWQRGRVVMAHNWYADTDTHDYSLSVLYLGGWSTHLRGRERDASEARLWSTYLHTHLPIERAEDQSSWTLYSGGTSSCTLGSSGGRLEETITTGSASSTGYRYVEQVEAIGGAPAATAQWTVDTDSTVTSDARVAMRVRLDNGSHGIEVDVRPSDTTVAIYDVVSGALLGTTSGMGTGPKQYRLGMYMTDAGVGRYVRIWWRKFEPAAEERSGWDLVGAYTLTDDSGSFGSCRIQWGCRVAPIINTLVTSVWCDVAHTFGDATKSTSNVGSYWPWWLLDLTKNPTGLWGGVWSQAMVYAGNGVSLMTRSGPAVIGEDVSVGYTGPYPIEAIWPSRALSPRRGWRNVTDGVDSYLALQVDGGLSGEPVGLMALVIGESNVRLMTIQRHSGGAWVDDTSVDLAHGLTGLTFVRSGSTVKPNAASTIQIARGEFDGWTAELSATVKRRIKVTRGGGWHPTTGSKARLLLEGALVGDPGSGATMAIVAPGGVVIFAPGAAADGWRLKIPAQTTVDGDYRIGMAWFGDAHLLGRVPGWGTARTMRQGIERSETPSRVGSLRRAAPSIRLADIAWSDTIDQTQHYSGSEPDYVSIGGEGSTVAATALDLQGVIDENEDRPVVYVPDIGTSLPATLIRRHEWLYGTITGDVRSEVVIGNEGDDETVRIATVTITEEV